MKKVISFIITLVICLSFTSCVATAEAQTDGIYASTDGVDVIITYGTPYYDAEGLLLYYIYRDLFYYPYYSSDRWYFRAYSRPLRYARPVPRDFYHHRPHIKHGWYHGTRPPRGNYSHNGNIHRPNINTHSGGGFNRHNNTMRGNTRIQSLPRPQMNNRGSGFSRHSSPQRSSTSGSGGHFGGRR